MDDHLSRKSIKKQELLMTLWTRCISDICRTLYPKTTEHSFFSSAHGTFSRIDHLLGHKSGLNQYQKTEIISCMFSDHNALKLELKHKKKYGRNSNTWKLKTTLLQNVWINQEIKEELKQFMETNENEDTSVKTYGIGQRWS